MVSFAQSLYRACSWLVILQGLLQASVVTKEVTLCNSGANKTVKPSGITHVHSPICMHSVQVWDVSQKLNVATASE